MKVDATNTYQRNYQQDFTARTKFVKKIKEGNKVYNLRVFNNQPGTDQVLDKGIIRVEYVTQPRSILGIQLPEKIILARTIINVREWAETITGRKSTEIISKTARKGTTKKTPRVTTTTEANIKTIIQHLKNKSKTLSDIGPDGMIK